MKTSQFHIMHKHELYDIRFLWRQKWERSSTVVMLCVEKWSDRFHKHLKKLQRILPVDDDIDEENLDDDDGEPQLNLSQSFDEAADLSQMNVQRLIIEELDYEILYNNYEERYLLMHLCYNV